MPIHKIIKNIHTAFKPARIVQNLADLTGTSEEWWNSHGRPLPTFNAQNTGKRWEPVESWLAAVELYENAAKGAGVMLAEEVTQMIRHKYAAPVCKGDQRDLANCMLKETTEGVLSANKSDFGKMTTAELEAARVEVAEAVEASKQVLDELDRQISARRAVQQTYIGEVQTTGARAN